MTMKLSPEKFNGFFFQVGSRIASDFQKPFDWAISGISTNNTERNQNFPKYSGKVYSGAVKVINVTLTDAPADRDSLVTAMDVTGDQQIPLYALDEFGNRWYVNAVCIGLTFEEDDIDENGKTARFGYVFEVDDPTWIRETVNVATWNITASGDTKTITIGGNQPTQPTYVATPTTNLANYYPGKIYIKNYNPIPKAQTDGIDITNGGWNHAAEVALGNSLASGDDVKVYVDGAEVPRYPGGGGWDSATLKLYIRLMWLPGQFLTLQTAVANVGTPAVLQFKVTAANKTALAAMPIKGIIRLDNEEFTYSSRNAATCRMTVSQRTVRGTSIATHSTGAIAWWVEHDIKIIFGDPLANTPVYSQTYKPVFDLDTSPSNSVRDYVIFADANFLRAGSFKGLVINDGQGKLNRIYTGDQATQVDADPATDMGMEIASYQDQGKAQPETAEIEWRFYHPANITEVDTAGESYKLAAATTWPAKACLQSSTNGKKWIDEWNEGAPSNPATWTAWTHNNEAIANRPYIRYYFYGSVNGITNNVARFEINTVQVTLDSSRIIQVGMNTKQAGLHFSSLLENLNTDKAILIEYPVSQNQSLTIDTADLEVTYRGMNAIRGISLDGIRTEWLELVPGPNVLRYTANTWTGAITILIYTQDKGL